MRSKIGQSISQSMMDLESLQWITRFTQAGVAVLKVKEAVLYLLDYPFPAVRVTFEDQNSGGALYKQALPVQY